MSELVTIEVYSSVGKAELMRSVLEEQGVTCYLADDQIAAMDWLLMSAVGGVKLQVAQQDVDRAQVLLAEAAKNAERKSEVDVEFECEECGQPLCMPGARRGGVETCKHCGCFVDVPE